MTDETPNRRWFQFRLRTLLIAVLVLSLPLSWFAWRMERARRQREAVEEIERAGGGFISELDRGSSVPACMVEVLGEDFFYDVDAVWVYTKDFGDDESVCLRGLTELKSLGLGGTQVTDAGFRHLEGLARVNTLNLGGTQITDTGLEHLEGLTSMTNLNLNCTQITDAGLEHLKGLTNLEMLSLFRTNVTDDGLDYFVGLTSLISLELRDTQVTPEGVRKLQEALPNCRIDY